MKIAILGNSRSGGWGRWQPTLERLAARERAALLDCGERPLKALLADAVRDGVERLVVAGGDGTLSCTVNALAPQFDALELALLPTGTGNDLARSIGVSSESLDAAWRLAVNSPAVAVDLIRVTNGSTCYLVNAATGGFGGKVTTDVETDDKHRWGATAYWMTAFSKLGELIPFDIHLELDDRSVAFPMYGLAIANGRYVGGGFPVAPAATINDGILNITAVPVLPALELLSAGLDFVLGRSEESDVVETYLSTRVRVHSEPDLPFSLDGEPSRGIDALFEVVPQALRLVCGPQAALNRRQGAASLRWR